MQSEKVISGHNLSIGYNKTKHTDKNILYKDLSFDLFAGELICLIGANGAGKSTLLRSISANQVILQGKVFFKGKDITQYKEKDLSKLLGIILTDKTNVGGLTVRELVELGRYPYTGFFGQLSNEDKEIAQQAMVNVGISHKSDSYVAELSDGERQKAMIAKAITQECPILLLDEPTAFLDIEGRIEIMSLLHELAVNQNKTILLSTHDLDLAFRLADRLWLLSKEKGLQIGVTEDLILDGAMDNFFASENIQFVKESGNYIPKSQGVKSVFVDSEGTSAYWCKNILLRHHFSICEDAKNADFIIRISENKSIEIIEEGQKYNLNNFSELSSWLKSKQ